MIKTKKEGTPCGVPTNQPHSIRRLLTLQEKVETILERSLKARENDNYLAYRIYHDYYKVNMKEAMEHQEENYLPSVESIGRCRRKAQKLRPELRASHDTETKRFRAKIDFIEYAKE